MALTAAQKAFYEANGYLVVENVVDDDILQRLRTTISEMTQAASEARGLPTGARADYEGSQTVGGTTAASTKKMPLRKLSELAPVDPFFRAVACSDRIVDIAAELAGNATRVMLYDDQVFLKPAFCGGEKPLHQDNSYFRVTPFSHGVTCWLAVDDATVENGCMNYIPGTHKLGLLNHKSLTPAHLTPDVPFDLGQEIPVPVKAGSAIFHHLLTLHSSKANKSANSRRAWALHYANRDATSAVKAWDDMMPVR